MLDSILLNLYTHLAKLQPGVGVYRFGSSIQLNKPYNDVDALVLIPNASQDYSNLCYEFNDLLYERLYNGGVDAKTYFYLYHDEISNLIDQIVNSHNIEKTNIVPMHFYGPSIETSNNGIKLHIKGPITHSVFQNFIENFPFHGISILHNNINIGNSSNLLKKFSYLRPTFERYDMERKALISRLTNSHLSRNECRKILKKLEHNLQIMNGNYDCMIRVDDLIDEHQDLNIYVDEIISKYI